MNAAESLRDKGLISEERARILMPVEDRRLFALHGELRALLYMGALLAVWGVGATVARRFRDLGTAAIVGGLSILVGACYWYCFSRGRPYAPSKVESPTAAFDYVLYLGCGLLGIELSYIESQLHLLKNQWRHYLLPSGVWFVWLAYRFDNRFALTSGLLSVGGWLELTLGQHGLAPFSWRTRLAFYGVALFEAGRRLAAEGIKPHFEVIYASYGYHCLALALLPGLGSGTSPETFGLFLLAFAGGAYGWQKRRFAFVVYGVGYGYVAALSFFRDVLTSADATAWFFLITTPAVIAGLVAARRRLRLEAD